MITTFAIIVFLLSFKSDFNKPQKRQFRGFLFLALGICAGAPLMHLIFFPTTIKGFLVEPSIFYWVLGGASYIIGALMYVFRFPERLIPGYVDFFVSDLYNY